MTTVTGFSFPLLGLRGGGTGSPRVLGRLSPCSLQTCHKSSLMQIGFSVLPKRPPSLQTASRVVVTETPHHGTRAKMTLWPHSGLLPGGFALGGSNLVP